MHWKRRIIAGICGSLCLSGCTSFSAASTNNSRGSSLTAPAGTILIKEGQVIEAGGFRCRLPDGFSWGSDSFTGKTAAGVKEKYQLSESWRTQELMDDVQTKSDQKTGDSIQYLDMLHPGIMLYIMYGIDPSSPSEELTNTEINSSISSYASLFRQAFSIRSFTIDPAAANDEMGQQILTEDGKSVPRTSDDKKWYYISFVSYAGNAEQTSYGASCYPKTYYGILLISSDCLEEGREYYVFAFSNDGNGGILSEDEYEHLFQSIREQFHLSLFYTPQQIVYDENKAMPYGRTYVQIEELFQESQYYYQMKKAEGTEEQDSGFSLNPHSAS